MLGKNSLVITPFVVSSHWLCHFLMFLPRYNFFIVFLVSCCMLCSSFELPTPQVNLQFRFHISRCELSPIWILFSSSFCSRLLLPSWILLRGGCDFQHSLLSPVLSCCPIKIFRNVRYKKLVSQMNCKWEYCCNCVAIGEVGGTSFCRYRHNCRSPSKCSFTWLPSVPHLTSREELWKLLIAVTWICFYNTWELLIFCLATGKLNLDYYSVHTHSLNLKGWGLFMGTC